MKTPPYFTLRLNRLPAIPIHEPLIQSVQTWLERGTKLSLTVIKDAYNVNVGPVQVDIVPPENVIPIVEYITRPEVMECGIGASCRD